MLLVAVLKARGTCEMLFQWKAVVLDTESAAEVNERRKAIQWKEEMIEVSE